MIILRIHYVIYFQCSLGVALPPPRPPPWQPPQFSLPTFQPYPCTTITPAIFVLIRKLYRYIPRVFCCLWRCLFFGFFCVCFFQALFSFWYSVSVSSLEASFALAFSSSLSSLLLFRLSKISSWFSIQWAAESFWQFWYASSPFESDLLTVGSWIRSRVCGCLDSEELVWFYPSLMTPH